MPHSVGLTNLEEGRARRVPSAIAMASMLEDPGHGTNVTGLAAHCLASYLRAVTSQE